MHLFDYSIPSHLSMHSLPINQRLVSLLSLLSLPSLLFLEGPPPGQGWCPFLAQRWKKTTFLQKQGLSQNNFTNCVNYNKSNLQQNSVQGPKDQNCAKRWRTSLRFISQPMPEQTAWNYYVRAWAQAFFYHLKRVLKTLFWQTMSFFYNIFHHGREWQR